MKTKITSIAMSILFVIGTAVNANQRNFKTSNLKFLKTNGISLEQGIHTNFFNFQKQTEIELSVPGYSADYSWDIESNKWQHVSNTTYTYDFNGNLQEEIVQEAQTDVYITRNSYSRDESENLIEEVSYIMGADEWIPVSGEKSVYTISPEGYINGVIEQTLENGEWMNKTRQEYILNSSGIPIGLQTYQWEADDWALYSKTVNITWADWQTKKMAAYTTQYRQNGTWFNGERYSAEYQGNNYTGTFEVWNNTEWSYSKQEFYSRNANEEILLLREWTENGWIPTEKYTTNFDFRGNQTGFFYSTWNGINWSPEMEFYFDLTYNGIDVTEMAVRYRDPNIEEPVYLSKYQFSSFLHFIKTDVNDLNILENVMVYPNPASSAFNILIDETGTSKYTVNIFDFAGQTIFSNTYSNPSISINTEGFTNGMYLLNIKTDDGRIFNSKLLKQ